MGPIGGGRGRGRYRPMAEINVTPMVDVMLVLLIIFMVAAPMMTVGVPVDLPKTQAGAVAQEQEPLTLSVDRDGRIFVQDTETSMEALVPKLREILGERVEGQPERRVFIRGDRANQYGRVLEVMGAVSSAGFTRIALLSEAAVPAAAAPAATPPAARAPAPRPAGR
ncbi:cell division and transport-associated protein TolR [Humitalea rosea]|uniref:Cell division and transport-associated protein TolR n=2 Tax=Humitalea rosea TaxID=990373 RepID=A0A2W7I9Z3_9PROT|nr:cell division and transport-associated protein TolR [Humitalea rosea]